MWSSSSSVVAEPIIIDNLRSPLQIAKPKLQVFIYINLLDSQTIHSNFFVFIFFSLQELEYKRKLEGLIQGAKCCQLCSKSDIESPNF